MTRGLLAAGLAITLMAGCDRPFEPLAENGNGPFSMIGYLDLGADTQWVRVMPVRPSALSAPEPIDAVVTLQRVGSGRTVTLRDSLFRYRDARLDADLYAHLFWTTERLEARARYRLTATRSDGAASTALVDMPGELEFTYLNLRDTASVEVRTERLLLVETFHAMRLTSGERAGSSVRRHRRPSPFGNPPTYGVIVDGAPLIQERMVDVRRIELRIATATAAWPPDLAPASPAAGVPDTMASNVENGLGFVGGVATRTIPFHRCDVLALRADTRFSACMFTHDRESTSLFGRVIRQPCGRPHALAEIGVRATFADGGAALLRWRTGWGGEYRFEGIEPGAVLVLQLPGASAVPLPRLAPGERHAVPDLLVTTGC